ncbi:MAG: hypothetical protein V1775_14110 [Bacteroidota bacterium]
MRIFLFFLFISLVLPFTCAIGQDGFSDSLVVAERDYFYRKYKTIRDTMTINTWLNLKRVSDNLEQVVQRDQQVLVALKYRISTDSALIADLKVVSEQYRELDGRYDQLNVRYKKDLATLLIFKLLIAALSFLLLILLFFLISRINRLKRCKLQIAQEEAIADDRQHQLDVLDAELRKLKQRELEFRDELEKGMGTYQERLLALQERCGILEKENLKLKEEMANGGNIHLPDFSEVGSKLELSENIDDLKQMVKSLFDERNSLMNLAGKLRKQAEEENRKSHEIINRINILAKDLSADQKN